MRLRAAILGLLTCAMTASSVVAQSSSSEGASVWDGVYTDQQAARGQAVARNHCAQCHATDWTGLEGPPLVGDSFMRTWGPRPLQRLFEKIAGTMPPGAVETVSDTEKLDVLAFLLQQNGLPSGERVLARDAPVLLGTRPIARASRPVVGSLVQASGCLTGPGPEWELRGATEPAFPTSDANESRGSATSTPGTVTIRLINVFPNPADKVGRAVRVQGLLVSLAPAFVINVVSLVVASQTC